MDWRAKEKYSIILVCQDFWNEKSASWSRKPGAGTTCVTGGPLSGQTTE